MGTRESSETYPRAKATLRIHGLWFGLFRLGGSDDVPSVMEAGLWPANLGSVVHPNRCFAFVKNGKKYVQWCHPCSSTGT
jgi:hypothetical protein